MWWILAGSSVALLASAQGRLLASGLWALGDTKTSLRLSLLRVTLSAGLGVLATFPLRQAWNLGPMQAAAALSLGSSLAGWIELQLTRRALRRRIGPFCMGMAWTLRFAAVAAAAAALAYGAKLSIAAFLPSFLPPWVSGGMVLGVYGGSYLLGTYALGAAEVRQLVGRVRRK